MEKKFKNGDVVRLKSGSPDMTVERYHKGAVGLKTESRETSEVECTYYDDKKEKKNACHEQDALELVIK